MGQVGERREGASAEVEDVNVQLCRRVRPRQRNREGGQARRGAAPGDAVQQEVAVDGVPPERLLALVVAVHWALPSQRARTK